MRRERCEIQVAYAIGMARPISVLVETFGTETVDQDKINRVVQEIFDLRPAAIIRDLDLRKPKYKATAAYGHFGRIGDSFTWELTNRVDELKSALGLVSAGEWQPLPAADARNNLRALNQTVRARSTSPVSSASCPTSRPSPASSTTACPTSGSPTGARRSSASGRSCASISTAAASAAGSSTPTSRPTAGVTVRALAKISGLGPDAAVVDLARWTAWRWAGRVAAALTAASPGHVVTTLPAPARPAVVPVGATTVDGYADRAFRRAARRDAGPGVDRRPRARARRGARRGAA